MQYFFKKKIKRKWTLMSPDKKTEYETDHLLINDMSIVNDITVLSHFKFDSDPEYQDAASGLERKLELKTI